MIECPELGCLYAAEDETDLEVHKELMDKHNLHASQVSGNPRPFCIGCYRVPSEIPEYVNMALMVQTRPDNYVMAEEGTYNPENGHFLCDTCYINVGQPSSPAGWKAP